MSHPGHCVFAALRDFGRCCSDSPDPVSVARRTVRVSTVSNVYRLRSDVVNRIDYEYNTAMNALARLPLGGEGEWRRRLVKPVVPEGEGVAKPLSLRVPEKLIERIDAVAKATGNPRTDTIMHLLRWALDEYARQRAEETEEKRSRK